MSTQEMQIPRMTAANRPPRWFVLAVLLVATLAVGAVVGRSTAPTTRSQADVRPVTALSTVGTLSIGDARRVEMNRAMNGILADTAPALGSVHIGQKSALSADAIRRAEMFRRMNRLLPQQR